MKWVFTFPFLILALSLPVRAAVHGYVDDVRAERNERYHEVFLFSEPPVRMKPLHDIIFNVELSREFKEKYREKFGQNDTESISYQQTDYSRLEANKATTAVVKENSTRRAFAEYMMKRLTEWHVDHYIKSEPAMRPVYEVKQKLQKVEVRVNKETKLEARYELAGNTLDLILENPYCDSKWTIEMDPSAFGPSSVEDNKVTLGRPLTTSLRAENVWSEKEGRSKIELIRSHTPRLSSSYGVSAAYKETEFSGESRLALGMTYSF